ncbi:toxin-antitoxin system YwqK family antitoxin [Snodgrassella alvi]|uniref:toxin-antitoxin system YwqK family antitoxin n=1 Tax=Snodgrassella alvi TaxID=1196083 RepID=UPI001179D85D|nr:toxin-antitoxin system YwqK family antitoxin [Snodgrassella alvi]
MTLLSKKGIKVMYVARRFYWFVLAIILILIAIVWQVKLHQHKTAYFDANVQIVQKQSEVQHVQQFHAEQNHIGVPDSYHPSKIKYNDSYALPIDKLQQFIPAMKEGELQLSYPDGKKKLQGEYKNSKPVGKWHTWYPNGQMAIEMNWQKGMPSGRTLSWYENGQKRGELYFINGKVEGRWQRWYSNGQIKQDMNVHHGEVQTMTTWDDKGRLLADVAIHNNKISGVVLSWYESGAKKSESVFEKNELVRKTEWDEDGLVVDLNDN